MNLKKLAGISGFIMVIAFTTSCNKHLCDAYSSNHYESEKQNDNKTIITTQVKNYEENI